MQIQNFYLPVSPAQVGHSSAFNYAPCCSQNQIIGKVPFVILHSYVARFQNRFWAGSFCHHFPQHIFLLTHQHLLITNPDSHLYCVRRVYFKLFLWEIEKKSARVVALCFPIRQMRQSYPKWVASDMIERHTYDRPPVAHL